MHRETVLKSPYGDRIAIWHIIRSIDSLPSVVKILGRDTAHTSCSISVYLIIFNGVKTSNSHAIMMSVCAASGDQSVRISMSLGIFGKYVAE